MFGSDFALLLLLLLILGANVNPPERTGLGQRKTPLITTTNQPGLNTALTFGLTLCTPNHSQMFAEGS